MFAIFFAIIAMYLAYKYIKPASFKGWVATVGVGLLFYILIAVIFRILVTT